MIRHHPSQELLLEYAAGTLSSGMALCVNMHLKYCPHCAEIVDRMTHVGGMLMEELEPVEVAPDSFDALMQRIDEEDMLAAEVKNTKGLDRARELLSNWIPGGWNVVSWKPQWFKIYEFLLATSEDGRERLSLQRINAGGVAPVHSHYGREVTVVLEGGFSDEQGVYQAGDFIIKDQQHKHRPRAHENEDCICLALLEAPVRLTGPVGQWIERLRNFFSPQMYNQTSRDSA